MLEMNPAPVVQLESNSGSTLQLEKEMWLSGDITSRSSRRPSACRPESASTAASAVVRPSKSATPTPCRHVGCKKHWLRRGRPFYSSLNKPCL